MNQKTPPPPKAKPSTQDFVEIEDVIDDTIMLRDGSVCMVLEVTAINFGLFSEKEQEATIYAYAQLLNSLTFSIQIVIISKRKDITDYLKLLDRQMEQAANPEIRTQLVKYRDFVKSIVRQGNVLDKKFYISIPFSSLELGVSHSLLNLGKSVSSQALPKADIVEKATTNLAPKRDHLIRLLARIGLRAKQLSSSELLQIFYDQYNPGHFGTKVQLITDSNNP